MKILHLDSSILGAGSVSRELTAAIICRLSGDVVRRDLVADPLPHVTPAALPGDHPVSAMAGPLDPAAQAVRDESQAVLDEFLAADVVVIGAPMYNFTIASQLKAWVDRIVVPGKTFAYGANGPEGLAGAKRVIVALVRGGFYGPETAAASAEHAETYLRSVFGFIGITAPEFIFAEGVAAGDETKAKALASAHAAIGQLAA